MRCDWLYTTSPFFYRPHKWRHHYLLFLPNNRSRIPIFSFSIDIVIIGSVINFAREKLIRHKSTSRCEQPICQDASWRIGIDFQAILVSRCICKTYRILHFMKKQRMEMNFMTEVWKSKSLSSFIFLCWSWLFLSRKLLRIESRIWYVSWTSFNPSKIRFD